MRTAVLVVYLLIAVLSVASAVFKFIMPDEDENKAMKEAAAKFRDKKCPKEKKAFFAVGLMIMQMIGLCIKVTLYYVLYGMVAGTAFQSCFCALAVLAAVYMIWLGISNVISVKAVLKGNVRTTPKALSVLGWFVIVAEAAMIIAVLL